MCSTEMLATQKMEWEHWSELGIEIRYSALRFCKAASARTVSVLVQSNCASLNSRPFCISLFPLVKRRPCPTLASQTHPVACRDT
ncbi:hypothetical protein C8J55DRAFT_527854 [Lentinula edodes]|uniref:Uncharacterized protein n=1 Tax=Lentinula lateritia TaxID=40482 RepID=A0A9W8ZSK5_9AGAR|nr:hypothetical protein C8J55DRAFT_527854 [Lentinula edodes]